MLSPAVGGQGEQRDGGTETIEITKDPNSRYLLRRGEYLLFVFSDMEVFYYGGTKNKIL